MQIISQIVTNECNKNVHVYEWMHKQSNLIQQFMKVVINIELQHWDKNICYNIYKDLPDLTTNFKNIKQVKRWIIKNNT